MIDPNTRFLVITRDPTTGSERKSVEQFIQRDMDRLLRNPLCVRIYGPFAFNAVPEEADCPRWSIIKNWSPQ